MAKVREETLSLCDDKIHPRVKIAGSGPALLYLHGDYGLIWNEFLDKLAEHFTVYAPEHPGTTPGDPDGLKPLDDMWDLVLYNYDLMDRLKLKSATVVGDSFGGMVAAEIAATNPDRVSKLALLAPMGLWRDDTPIKNYIVTPAAELAPLILKDPAHPITKDIFTDPNNYDADKIIRITWTLACVGKFIWPIPDKGLKKRMHRIKAPTLIVWGKQDRLIPPVYAEDFRKGIAGAKVELIDNASHMLTFEQPAAIAKAVAGFLK